MSENFQYLKNGFYIVRTQAGFKQAVKHFWPRDPQDFKTEIHGYPRAYPSLIVLTQGYNGGIYVRVNSITINDINKMISDNEAKNKGLI